MVERYSDLFELPLIEKNPNKQPSFEEYIPPNTRYDPRSLRVRVRYPVILREGLEEVVQRQAQSQLMGWSGFSLDGSDLVSDVEVPSGSTSAVNSTIQYIEKTIEYKNNDVKRLNDWLKQQIRNYSDQRKQQIETRRNAIQELARTSAIPLVVRSPNEALVVDLTVKRTIKELIPDQTSLGKEDLQLDRGQVMQLISVVHNAGYWFARTPSVFSKLQEEQLRDILLGGLNMIFQGAALGEAFNHSGHTDIFLKVSKGQILIGECKIWEGEAYYKGAVSQILKYLTWYENYGIVITFSKMQGFTEVLSKAMHAIENSENYVTGTLKVIDKTHFQSIHTLPTDAAKKVEMHHLLFDIPQGFEHGRQANP